MAQRVAGKQRVQEYLAREEAKADLDGEFCQQERHERCFVRHLMKLLNVPFL